jgi:predicted nucleotidyltransferase
VVEPDNLEQLISKLRPLFEKYGILKAVVFGSLARGEPSRRSDLDLMLVQETDKRFLDRYKGILGELTDVVRGRDVDLLIYTPAELASMSERRFMQTILKEGVVIYESQRQSLSS